MLILNLLLHLGDIRADVGVVVQHLAVVLLTVLIVKEMQVGQRNRFAVGRRLVFRVPSIELLLQFLNLSDLLLIEFLKPAALSSQTRDDLSRLLLIGLAADVAWSYH